MDVLFIHFIEMSISYMPKLVVFNVPSTARSFKDGTPHLLSLAKDVKLDKYTVPTGN